MPNQKPIPLEDKLAALRRCDPVHPWHSLDDRRTCILCEKNFTGRMVEVTIGSTGRVRLKCPTEGCNGTPNVWVSLGNPLVSEKAWRDWDRVLKSKARPRRDYAKRIFA